MTKLIEVTIRVRDVERSRAFYERLGLPCGPVDADEPGGQRHAHALWGEWKPGSDDFLMLNIYPTDGDAAAKASIGFATDDLAALHARLVAAGVEVVHAPDARPWGTMATYRDPDGNTVSVSQRPR